MVVRAARHLHRSASILGGKGHIEMFLDGPGAKARDAVHVVFAGEKVRPEYVATDTFTFPGILAGDMRRRAIAEHKLHRPWPAHRQAAMPAEVAGPLSWKGWK